MSIMQKTWYVYTKYKQQLLYQTGPILSVYCRTLCKFSFHSLNFNPVIDSLLLLQPFLRQDGWAGTIFLMKSQRRTVTIILRDLPVIINTKKQNIKAAKHW